MAVLMRKGSWIQIFYGRGQDRSDISISSGYPKIARSQLKP